MVSSQAFLLGLAVTALAGGGSYAGYQMMVDGSGACGMPGGMMGGHMQDMHARCDAMMPGQTTPSPAAASEGDIVVDMQSSQFQPATLRIRAGDTVTWLNQDGYAHTVTSDSGAAPLDSPSIPAGGSWSHTFTEPGTYDYHCKPHAYRDDAGEYRGMVGRIIVE